jgi:hypothetical protein
VLREATATGTTRRLGPAVRGNRMKLCSRNRLKKLSWLDLQGVG